MGVVTVHHGDAGVPLPGPSTIDLASATTGEAFALNLVNQYGNAGDPNIANATVSDLGGTVELTDPDTVTLARDPASLQAGGHIYSFAVLDNTDQGDNGWTVAGVYDFSLASGVGNEIGTVDVSADITDPDQCVPFIAGQSSDANTQGLVPTARHIAYLSGTDLVVERVWTGGASTVKVVLVEFGANWQVGKAQSAASPDVSADLDLTWDGSWSTPDWGATWLISQLASSDSGLDSQSCIAEVGPTASQTTVDFQGQASLAGGGKVQVYAVYHPDLAVTRYNDTGDLGATWQSVDITSAGVSSVDTALVWGQAYSSGGGTAFGRGVRAYRLDSTTQASHYCHRSGNTLLHMLQVVDFDGIAASTTPNSVDVSATLPTPTAAATASTEVSLDADANLPVPSLSVAAGAVVTAVVAGDLPSLGFGATASADATVAVDGALPGLVLSGAVQAEVAASVAGTLPSPTVEAAVQVTTAVSADAILPGPTLDAGLSVLPGVGASFDLPGLDADASVSVRITASSVVTLPLLTMSAESAGEDAFVSASFALPLPSLAADVSTHGAVATSLDLPTLTSAAVARSEVSVDVALQLPLPWMSAEVGFAQGSHASFDLPGLQVSVEASVEASAQASLSFRLPTIDAEASPVVAVDGSMSLPVPSLDAQVGRAAIEVDVALLLPVPSLSAASGVVAGAQVDVGLPDLDLDAALDSAIRALVALMLLVPDLDAMVRTGDLVRPPGSTIIEHPGVIRVAAADSTVVPSRSGTSVDGRGSTTV